MKTPEPNVAGKNKYRTSRKPTPVKPAVSGGGKFSLPSRCGSVSNQASLQDKRRRSGSCGAPGAPLANSSASSSKSCFVRTSIAGRGENLICSSRQLEANDMTSRDAEWGVLAFLKSYGRAFEAFDTDAILTHFLFPCHIVSDAEAVSLVPLANASEARVGVERVLALHRELGVQTGRILDLDVIELSPRMAALVLRYEFSDAAGRSLYDFQGIYTLVKVDRRYRIAAISHNQIPRLVGRVEERRAPP